jgi:hypothetical protein
MHYSPFSSPYTHTGAPPLALFALVISQIGSAAFCLGPASDLDPPTYANFELQA